MGGAAPPMPNKARTPQRALGRYELIGELARGGMGTVYLARHEGEAGFQRLFAIKVMHPHLAEESAFVDMLHDEARIAARIHHPNVVSIVDLGSRGDLHYVVMDYIEGTPLTRMLKRGTDATSAERAVTIMIDALEGLHAAHTVTDDDGVVLQLVHRDVSPQNILVGVDGVSRITDFGIAKAETRITSTQPGMRKGKLAFMAPEQITNDTIVDRRADIFAAGIVLWTSLTCKNLFRGDNDAVTISNVLSLPIEPPSKAAADVPAFFDDVVMRSLERDPSKRFDSALDMAEALRDAAAANGVGCSKHRVAKWVTETFGEELLARRKAIRSAARRRDEQQEGTETSHITMLPALPNVGGTSPGGSLSSTFQEGPNPNAAVLNEDDDSSSITASINPVRLSSEHVTLLEDPGFRPKLSPVWLGAGFAVLVAGVIQLIMRTGAPEPQPTISAQPAAVRAPPVAPTPPDSPRATQAANTVAPAPAAGSSAADEPAGTKPRTARSHIRRPLVRSAAGRAVSPPAAARGQAPTETTRSEPVPTPADKGATTPVPGPAGIDRNPYMRRSEKN